MLAALVLLCSIGMTDCRQIAESPGQTELPFMPAIRDGGSRQTSRARRQVPQGGVRPQERAPDYLVVAAWSALLIFIGAGAFVIGMAIHNETLARHGPRIKRYADMDLYNYTLRMAVRVQRGEHQQTFGVTLTANVTPNAPR
jgi:hypothetical protein